MPDSLIYLDYNATTPIDKEAAEAMMPYLSGAFGNPSSSHIYGRKMRQGIEAARAQVAALMEADPPEIVFTSGGTESNNTVVRGVAEADESRGRHIIISSVEHPAIKQPCELLATQGYEITVLPVDDLGRVSPAEVEKALTPHTILVSVMLANNEVGTVQPVAEIAELAHAHGALMHTDAAQAMGKIPVDVAALGVDFLSVAGHKLYAPIGVGVLYRREGIDLPKFMLGAGQEHDRRAGTENVLEIVGLGQAAEVARRDFDVNTATMRRTRDRLWSALASSLTDLQRNGDPDDSLPNTLSVSFKGVQANLLLDRIGDRVAASAGAACHSDAITISAVLEAMRVPVDYAMGTLRLTTGKHTTDEEIDAAADIIVKAVSTLRGNH